MQAPFRVKLCAPGAIFNCNFLASALNISGRIWAVATMNSATPWNRCGAYLPEFKRLVPGSDIWRDSICFCRLVSPRPPRVITPLPLRQDQRRITNTPRKLQLPNYTTDSYKHNDDSPKTFFVVLFLNWNLLLKI